MKAYLIDPVNKTVIEVETNGKLRAEGGLPGIYDLTQCECVDILHIDYNGDHIFVDDEGLLNGAAQRFGMFMVNGEARSVPLAGYGLWLGSRGEYEAAPKRTLEEAKAMVTFHTFDEIRVRASTGEFD